MALPANRDEVAAERTAVIKAMVSSLMRAEPREYHVGLVGYYIEGVPHSATGLSLNMEIRHNNGRREQNGGKNQKGSRAGPHDFSPSRER